MNNKKLPSEEKLSLTSSLASIKTAPLVPSRDRRTCRRNSELSLSQPPLSMLFWYVVRCTKQACDHFAIKPASVTTSTFNRNSTLQALFKASNMQLEGRGAPREAPSAQAIKSDFVNMSNYAERLVNGTHFKKLPLSVDARIQETPSNNKTACSAHMHPNGVFAALDCSRRASLRTRRPRR